MRLLEQWVDLKQVHVVAKVDTVVGVGHECVNVELNAVFRKIVCDEVLKRRFSVLVKLARVLCLLDEVERPVLKLGVGVGRLEIDGKVLVRRVVLEQKIHLAREHGDARRAGFDGVANRPLGAARQRVGHGAKVAKPWTKLSNLDRLVKAPPGRVVGPVHATLEKALQLKVHGRAAPSRLLPFGLPQHRDLVLDLLVGHVLHETKVVDHLKVL